MLTPKCTGLVHTVLYLKSQRKLLKYDYNCPPPESLLRVQLAGSMWDDFLCIDLIVHSLNTQNPYLCLLHVFIYGKCSITECLRYLVFLEEHYRFCSVLEEHISIDVYTVIASIAIFSSLWSLVFFFSMASVTILIHDIIVMIGLLMRWSALPSTIRPMGVSVSFQ